ncbi:MAG: hypothetical protein PHI12_12765 [Dehalococcoidales bacterium]|nr:hypothetical protein [Dehalococcoidales bacterium]
MERKIILFKKTAKIALLLFGLLPFIFFILFFTIVGPGESTTSLFFDILGILTAISILGAPVFYIIHACRNKCFVKNQKYSWIALFFFGNFFVFPFYWYLHIWRAPKVDCPVDNAH